jgi:hypothetical protein
MFSEKLQFPRSEFVIDGVKQEPLLSSERFIEIESSYNLSDKTYADTVYAAYEVANLVRNTLRFETHSISQAPLSVESLADKQYTNCHGHAIVASECMDKIGIPHIVAIANQHSFIVLNNKDTGEFNLVDVAVRPLYVDITKAVRRFPGDSDREEVSTYFLRTDIILANSNFKSDIAATVNTRPWLSFASGKDTEYRYKPESDTVKAQTIIMRTYNPDAGRNVLQAYANFVHAVARKSYDEAHNHIQQLDGLYPDIDRRNKLKDPTRLVRNLATQGRINSALDDISIIERSVAPSVDLFCLMWPFDERRFIGRVACNKGLIEDAIDGYEDIRTYRSRLGLSADLLPAKIEAAKREWAIASKD